MPFCVVQLAGAAKGGSGLLNFKQRRADIKIGRAKPTNAVANALALRKFIESLLQQCICGNFGLRSKRSVSRHTVTTNQHCRASAKGHDQVLSTLFT
jgi:hypothetical protein